MRAGGYVPAFSPWLHKSAKRRLSNLKEKQSMLDSIAQETAKMQQRLGASDNLILDEYLSSIRDVEQQLDRMEARSGAVPAGTAAPLGVPDTFDEHMTVTYDSRLGYPTEAYIDYEVGYHQALLETATKALGAAQNQELKDLIQKAAPVVQHHLDRAKQIQTKLGTGS